MRIRLIPRGKVCTARESTTGIVQVQGRDTIRQRDWAEATFEIILGVALATLCWLTFFSMFPNPTNQTLTLLILLGSPIVLYLLSCLPYLGRWVTVATLTGLALFFASAYQMLWNGYLVLANIVIQIVNLSRGTGFVTFALEGDATQWAHDARFALWAAIILTSAAAVYSIREKQVLLGLLLTTAPVLLGLFLGVTPAVPLLLLLLLSWIGLIVMVSVQGPTRIRKDAPLFIKKTGGISFPLLFLTLALALVLSLNALFTLRTYQSPRAVDSARIHIVDTVNRLRYERWTGRPLTLSSGDLHEAKPNEYIGQTILKLTMENPASIHLRGFVGSNYEDGRWGDLEETAFGGENQGLMEWLASQGFFPQTQADLLYRMGGVYDLTSFSIDNLSVSSRYLYMPYELVRDDEITPIQVDFFRDTQLRARGFWGDREYSAQMFLPEIGDFSTQAAKARLDAAKASPDYPAYEQSEGAYRRFVDVYYQDVSDADEQVLEKIFGTPKWGASIDEILFDVRLVFDEEYHYDVQSPQTPEGEDPLTHFLADSKTGNNSFFATVAALQLRRAGYSTRYVEGYYLTPSYVELFRSMNDQTFDITDDMAHAWVEIYVDKVGWLPAEVVPGFYTLEKEQKPEEQETQTDMNTLEQSFYEDNLPVEETQESQPGKPEYEARSYWLLVLVVLLVVLAYELVGFERARRRRRRFEMDHSDVVAYEKYRYIENFMGIADIKLRQNPYGKTVRIEETLGTSVAEDFDEVLQTMCALRFGETSPDEAKHKQLTEFTTVLSSAVYAKKGFWSKLALRYLRFLV
jgi:hypothetical protein